MAARKKPELLIPASSLDVLKTAVTYGADAVYIGGEAFWSSGKGKKILAKRIWQRESPLRMHMT